MEGPISSQWLQLTRISGIDWEIYGPPTVIVTVCSKTLSVHPSIQNTSSENNATWLCLHSGTTGRWTDYSMVIRSKLRNSKYDPKITIAFLSKIVFGYCSQVCSEIKSHISTLVTQNQMPRVFFSEFRLWSREITCVYIVVKSRFCDVVLKLFAVFTCLLSDTFLEDFVLTHITFMPNNHLCPTLMA